MQPNVLLVVLDSVRARNVGHLGHPEPTTPHLDAFAERDRAVCYTNARAPGTWSLPSHVSMFTGLHVREHGITDRAQRLQQGHTIWETLADAGYETGVFSSNPYLTEVDVGLRDAFGTVAGRIDLPYPAAGDPREFVRQHGTGSFLAYVQHCLESDRPAQGLVNGAFEKLERDLPAVAERLPAGLRPGTGGDVYADRVLEWTADRTGPWAACVNLMDAHHPYEPRPEFDQWGGERLRDLQSDIDSHAWEFVGGQRPWWQRRALEALYNGAIRQADAAMGDLLGTLADRGVLDETLVVVTSDHGEGFGEPDPSRPGHRAVGHGNGGLAEPLLHVPLVVRYPDGVTPPSVRETPPATLTRFPEVVNGTREGEATSFAPEGPVLAATTGLDGPMRSAAAEYVDDIGPHEAGGDAVYRATEEPGVVRKATRIGDTWSTQVVRDALTAYDVDGETATAAEIVDALTDAGVGEAGGEVSDAVADRLEDLGYA
ncbi:sulfatase-like hydrolase/transferase [Haloglomus halophilum]|uniref:sulfatase-like hydrolase/transferase n=1 Tax=Haloglomus halophilum TaxID=2962672 RepID=UPI0020C9D18E|nr:sulfatase-like hydrolase/transferase [Haloglomus halophilum]